MQGKYGGLPSLDAHESPRELEILGPNLAFYVLVLWEATNPQNAEQGSQPPTTGFHRLAYPRIRSIIQSPAWAGVANA